MTEIIEPPWVACPEIPRGSIGWRMGYGEDHMVAWWDFVKTLPKDLSSRAAFLKQFGPAPINWFDHLQGVLYPEIDFYDDDAPEEETRAYILAENLVASDASFGFFKTKYKHPKDIRLNDTLESEMRYGSRSFGFMCRWLHEEPDLQNDMSFAKSWSLPVDIFTKPIPPNEMDLTQGLRSMGLLLLNGQHPAPWDLGMPPSAIQHNYEMDMQYADAFNLWIGYVIEDKAHFARVFPDMPETWQDWYEHLFFEG